MSEQYRQLLEAAELVLAGERHATEALRAAALAARAELEPPCTHEHQTTARTGDGREVHSCLDCGELLELGPMPHDDDEEATI